MCWSHDVSLFFFRCQCSPGWTGQFCQIAEETDCEDEVDNDNSKWPLCRHNTAKFLGARAMLKRHEFVVLSVFVYLLGLLGYTLQCCFQWMGGFPVCEEKLFLLLASIFWEIVHFYIQKWQKQELYHYSVKSVFVFKHFYHTYLFSGSLKVSFQKSVHCPDEQFSS